MAIGSIGLSLTDFCCLTIDEWNEVHKSWLDRENQFQKAEWERLRTLATITIQPHCRKKVNAKQLLPFPWDNEKPKKESKNIVSRDISKDAYERRLKMLEEHEQHTGDPVITDI